MTAHPFPVQPLLDLIRRRGLTPTQAATTLGITPAAIHTWAKGHRTHLTARTADRHATALGEHPTAIWGDLWWDHAHNRDAQRRHANQLERARYQRRDT